MDVKKHKPLCGKKFTAKECPTLISIQFNNNIVLMNTKKSISNVSINGIDTKMNSYRQDGVGVLCKSGPLMIIIVTPSY